ncbi:putative lactoylglutathione lyase [Citrus sinensis]|uniref:Lactoylglutathione lyase n=1 Tax=Citrus sinensis TaxID=2711 RepID=A0ACB8NSZ0_CITSI|nr:putative lactoylglutathione lyase [Citrus sinensis]KAH9800871.1 putative lactoylglutathione lyase [Citrus sinensis]
MLHVVYRVGDLDRTIKFYTECLGMKLLRKRDIPEEKYTNAFLGYGPEDSHFVIELTYNYGVDKYDIGTGFGHFGIAVDDAFGMELLRKRDNPEYKYTIAMMGYGPEDKNVVLELTYNYGVTDYDKGNAYAQIAIGTDDVYKTAEAIKLFGGKVTREPGPLPGINTKITACLDPDGWKTVFVDNVDFLKELE